MKDRNEQLVTAPLGIAELAASARRLLKPLASLQLTVLLFVLGTILVFFGTVAMMTKGLWTVVDEYFRSAFVWIPFDLIRKFGTVFFDLPKDGTPWRGAFPFPGGWTIGAVMLVNLIAAHATRFKFSRKRLGVIILHLGVIVLMLGELAAGLLAVESTMTMRIGETTDFVDVTRDYEIVISSQSEPDYLTQVLVPHRYIVRPGLIKHPELPFDLEVLEYWQNTGERKSERPFPEGTPDVFRIILPGGAPLWMRLTSRPESAGVDTDARGDIPSVRVRVLDKESGATLGEHLLSLWAYENFELNRRVFRFPPCTINHHGIEYTLLLRNKRIEKPYSLRLNKFEHGRYPGTDIPKDFASTVTVTDKASGDTHEVRIWMNNPLRIGDDSLYQHAVMYGDSGTVLQVVRNPARLMPYISCMLVTLGMLVHFGMRLSTFLARTRPAA